MKKLLAALFLSALAVAAIAAPGPRQEGPSQEQKIAHMEKALGIDAQKATQVVQILDEQHAKFKALHDKADDEMPPCEDMRALKKDTDAKLAAVLDSEQIKKLREMHKDHLRHHGKWRGEDRSSDGPGDML